MSKAKAPTIERQRLTCEAVTAYRIGDFTYESAKLTIVDGVVVHVEQLTRAPDMSAVAVGKAQSVLWKKVVLQNKNKVFKQ